MVSIHQFPEPVDDGVVERLERELGRAWETLVTEESPNDFPALPVREGEHVVVGSRTGRTPVRTRYCGSPHRKCDSNAKEPTSGW